MTHRWLNQSHVSIWGEKSWGGLAWPLPDYILNSCHLEQLRTQEERPVRLKEGLRHPGLGGGEREAIGFHWLGLRGRLAAPQEGLVFLSFPWTCLKGIQELLGNQDLSAPRLCRMVQSDNVNGTCNSADEKHSGFKRALNDFLFIFCLHVMCYWCHYLIIQRLVS